MQHRCASGRSISAIAAAWLPAYYGRLGFEKFEIGRRMREICVARGIPHDIEWTDDKRLYGDAWYDFIGSCRANLGSETGSNVFDFDGALRAKYDQDCRPPAANRCRSRSSASTPTRSKPGTTSVRSRRGFSKRRRCARPLILFSGKYLGLISPDEHYIELKKDFSIVDAVLGPAGRCRRLEAHGRPGVRSPRRFGRVQLSPVRRAGRGDRQAQGSRTRDVIVAADGAVRSDRIRCAAGRPRRIPRIAHP